MSSRRCAQREGRRKPRRHLPGTQGRRAAGSLDCRVLRDRPRRSGAGAWRSRRRQRSDGHAASLVTITVPTTCATLCRGWLRLNATLGSASPGVRPGSGSSAVSESPGTSSPSSSPGATRTAGILTTTSCWYTPRTSTPPPSRRYTGTFTRGSLLAAASTACASLTSCTPFGSTPTCPLPPPVRTWSKAVGGRPPTK
jgi:hypothetical protein